MKNTYDKALEAQVVKNFVATNNRVPNALELERELHQAKKNVPSLNEVGFSGHHIVKPGFATVSSADDENENRDAIFTDIALGAQRIDELITNLETSFRSVYATTKNIKHRLTEIESRVDNILLLSGNTDAFVYGFEENFLVQDKIDFTNTTASVEAGFVTIGRSGFGLVNMDDVHISYSTIADKGYVGSQNTSAVDQLKANDGNFWEHLVYTNYKQGRVSLILDMALEEAQFISEVRFTTQGGGPNGRIKATVSYSLDGRTYKTVSPQEVVPTVEEMVFNIGLDGVKTVRLMLSKDMFDNTTSINGQYVYVFSLDSVKLYSRSYSSDAESQVVAGPYEVLDEDGNEINFTKATCDLCITQGEESGVGTFLSVDGETYLPVAHNGDGLGIVTFMNGSGSGTEASLDESENAASIIDTAIVSLSNDEALLNTAVDEDFTNKVIRKSVLVKRNVPYSSDGERVELYGVSTGWFYDSINKQYRTTIYVSSPLGLILDLGSTSAFVNGLERSGAVHLLQGYSTFATSESNWQVIPLGIKHLTGLKKHDPLYPYNHKYLIEGYMYADTFTGERVYSGVEEYFGSLLEYVPPELFGVTTTDNLDVFTMDESSGPLVFKVKVRKQDSSWRNEHYDTSWSIARGESNQMWIKLILSSSIANASPIVTSVKVRVI